MTTKILIGADPEVTLVGPAGRVVPAWTVTKGTKNGEKELVNPEYGLSVHADGVALEFSMAPTDPQTWPSQVDMCLSLLSHWCEEKKVTHIAKPTVGGWSKDALLHPLAVEVGCSEDFSAYSLNPAIARPTVNMPDMGEERCFGGHIHIGYDKSLIPPFALVRLLDAFVYLPISNQDRQGQRRQFYGLPGLFREKPYGVEYRTPSNFWLYTRGAKTSLSHNILEVFKALENSADDVHAAYRAMNWDNVISILTTPETRAPVDKWWMEVGHGVSRNLGMNLRANI